MGRGGGGVDSVVLRRGHWRIAPPSTKARCQTRNINERFITRRFGVPVMTPLSSRDVNNITIEQMQEARGNNLHTG